jgi:hypothetical protein
MNFKSILIVVLVIVLSAFTNKPPKSKLQAKVESLAEQEMSKVIEWRHHIHENPELSNREFKTAEYIAAHLKSLGMEVQTGVAGSSAESRYRCPSRT